MKLSATKSIPNASRTKAEESQQKDTEQAGPRSLMRVLNIFDSLAKREEGMTLAELSTALSSPKTSLLGLLRPMVSASFLVQSGGRYRLGPAIYQLSVNILAGRTFSKVIRKFLEDLAERSGESVYLAAMDRDTRLATYIEGIESRQAVRYAVPAGTARPLYVSAAGRVLLAYQEDEWRERYIKSTKLISPVTGTPIDKAWLKEELRRIREVGVAVSTGEAVPGAAGIAAPLLLPDGTATHALLIAAPADRLERALPVLRQLITEVSESASAALREFKG